MRMDGAGRRWPTAVRPGCGAGWLSWQGKEAETEKEGLGVAGGDRLRSESQG